MVHMSRLLQINAFAKIPRPIMERRLTMNNKLKIVGAVLSILFGIFGIADGATTLKDLKKKED